MENLVLGSRISKKITPEIARILLRDKNGKNRPFSSEKLKAYTDAMKKKTFLPERLPEGAIFAIDTDGVIISGQHRLESAVQADYTFEDALFLVTDRDMFNELSVEKRTAAQIAAMHLKMTKEDLPAKVSKAIHGACGQLVFINSKKPYVSFRSQGYELSDLSDLYATHSEGINKIFEANNKGSDTALAALIILLEAGRISVKEACEYFSNKSLKTTKRSVAGWVQFYNDYKVTGTKVIDEKVTTYYLK
ncbi:MAG: hypothetical protein ACRCZ2_02770 [Fusobacteriaceae bacterium]